MGKASRAKRAANAPAASTSSVTSASGPAKPAAPAKTVRPLTRARPRDVAPAAMLMSEAPAVGIDKSIVGFGSGLASIAFTCWLLAHVPALAPVAIPAWVIMGLALGFLVPWLGLLLTVATVPFLGGAVDPITGEVLRVIPIYGAAARVLLDRFVLWPRLGRAGAAGPPWWAVAAAVAALLLYAFTAQTGSAAVGGNALYLDSAIRWLAGGPMAMMAAWIAASHLVAGRDGKLTLTVLGVTVVACVLALVAWAGVPGMELITFPGLVNGRLAALGYPTPTAMGVAISLPFAVAGALGLARWSRYAPWLALGVIGLALVVLVLTWSRGPLIALGVGAVLAVLATGRVDRRLALVGAGAGLVALAGLVAVRYGTTLDAILAAINGSMGSDVDRVNTWIAAVAIAFSSPLVGGGWHSLERVGDFATRNVVYSHNILLHGFAEGGIPLGITNATVILFSAWKVWVGRHTMAPYLIAAAVTCLVCGFWDMPQVRSYAAVMGGIALGMAAGPLIARSSATTPVE
jgi:hypothetical protein